MEVKQRIPIVDDIDITVYVRDNKITKIEVYRSGGWDTKIEFTKESIDKIPILLKMLRHGIYVHHLYEVEICQRLLENGAELCKITPEPLSYCWPKQLLFDGFPVDGFYKTHPCFNNKMRLETINKHIIDYLLDTPDWFGLYYDGFERLVKEIGVKVVRHMSDGYKGCLQVEFNDDKRLYIRRSNIITIGFNHLQYFPNINSFTIQIIQNYTPLSNYTTITCDINHKFKQHVFGDDEITNNSYKLYYNRASNKDDLLQLLFPNVNLPLELLREEVGRKNCIISNDEYTYIEIYNSSMERLSNYINQIVDMGTFGKNIEYFMCLKQHTDYFYEKVVNRTRQKYGHLIELKRKYHVYNLKSDMDIVIKF